MIWVGTSDEEVSDDELDLDEDSTDHPTLSHDGSLWKPGR